MKENAVLAPQAEGLVYFIIEADQATAGKASIHFGIGEGFFGKETFKLDCDTSQVVGNYIDLGKERDVSASGSVEVTLNSAKTVSRVVPGKAEKWTAYKYLYPGTDSDVLVDVKLTVKNLKKKTYPAHKLIGIKGVFDGQAVYQGFIEVESEDQKDLLGLDSIGANKSRVIHGVIQIPKKYSDIGGQIFIYMDGIEYCYTMMQEN
jgi:hypothetical protein